MAWGICWPQQLLIADRLNLGGARWGLDGAEAVLTIRAVIGNGDFRSTGAPTSTASTNGIVLALIRGNTRSVPDSRSHSPICFSSWWRMQTGARGR